MDQDLTTSFRSSLDDNEFKEDEDQGLRKMTDKPTASREQIVQLLRRLHHEQLVELLVPFVENDQSAYSRMIKEADSSVVFRKLFVHGLPLGTTEVEFRNFFECYGQIEAVELPIPRGNAEVKYGFIVFSTVDAVHKALVNPNKWFGGKEICCKVFTVRSSTTESVVPQQSLPLPPPPNRKIFVSGLPQDVNYNEFLALFSQFGAVESAQIAPTKGSGYVVFAHPNSAKEAIAKTNRTVWNGRQLTVAWFKKRPEDDSRAIARRTPMTVPQPLAWASAPVGQYPQGHISGGVPSAQWYSYPIYSSDPYYFFPVPVAAAPEVHMAPATPEKEEETFTAN